MKTAKRRVLEERGGVKLCVDLICEDGDELPIRYFTEKPKPGEPGVTERHYYDHKDEAQRAFSAGGTLTRDSVPGFERGQMPDWYFPITPSWYIR